MAFEFGGGIGGELCPGTHGIYVDAALTQARGKLDTTGVGGSETWHWIGGAFPDGDFWLKVGSPPNATARAPEVWDYEDKGFGPQGTSRPSPSDARRWRMLENGNEIGFLVRTDQGELKWYAEPTRVGAGDRIQATPGTVFRFERHTGELVDKAYRICTAGRRPDLVLP